MLLEMKATVEGCRALIYHTVRLADEATILRATDAEGAEALGGSGRPGGQPLAARGRQDSTQDAGPMATSWGNG